MIRKANNINDEKTSLRARHDSATANARCGSDIAAVLDALDARKAASEVGLLAYGGSIAYGLDTESSDIDIRGFYLPTREDLLLLRDRETIEVHDGTDAALHSARKMLSLLSACNPNVIEILGLCPEHILIGSKWFDLILENSDAFISRKCAGTFGGYATQQLRRIENSMTRDAGSTDTEGAKRSMDSAITAFSSRYASYAQAKIDVELAGEEAGSKGLLVSLDMRRVPINELRAMCGELDAIAKNADNLAARNRKKDTYKLSKHMSHLIHLLRMGSEMLESGRVNTYRTEDRDQLLALKRGMWMEEGADGTRRIDDAF